MGSAPDDEPSRGGPLLFKEEGTAAFRKGEWQAAANMYAQALGAVESEAADSPGRSGAVKRP
jgi:hypothetical protein